ncbi:hypothetical protein Leryth_022125 [Lithospermum erythrorhizon]|nr:hypothetical protein Leryth_022125 [Lithospermum erythrorhizon]
MLSCSDGCQYDITITSSSIPSLICSYPLYILYLCYFTPYILKILLFIYPLFITTSLLVISLVTAISPGLVKDTFLGTQSSKLQTNSLLSAYDAVSKILQQKIDGEDFHSLEALQIYNIVFDTSMLDEPGTNGDASEEYPEEKVLQTVESSALKISKNDRTRYNSGGILSPKEVTIHSPRETKYNSSISHAITGRCESARKEREWRSTLACKLFEEKHNSANIEGIEEDEDDEVGVNLCCLHAFKLSATKMNMGVGRRNLAKISKAVKGLGWMHKASKHSKKVHNNNGETLQFP